MQANQKQSLLFRGIYEFDDASGTLLAARQPHVGSADLFHNTAIVVRPNQAAIFVYKGKIADILGPGTHYVSSENFPVLTRLASWKFGFRSPLRCEIWFFSGHLMTGRRWGTSQPIVTVLDETSVPIRAFGNYNVRVTDPRAFLLKLVGSRSSMGISEIEEFIQGHIIELLPQVLRLAKSIRDLSALQKKISSHLEDLMTNALRPFGLGVQGIQVLSLLPPKEVIQAMDTKLAMDVIGDKREYLLYKAAASLDALHSSSGSDPMQMMMGLMLGKGLMGADYHDKENHALPRAAKVACPHCQSTHDSQNRFCPQCGKEVAS
jgi:membrane protease subunit (stomatin/prohibitin family)